MSGKAKDALSQFAGYKIAERGEIAVKVGSNMFILAAGIRSVSLIVTQIYSYYNAIMC